MKILTVAFMLLFNEQCDYRKCRVSFMFVLIFCIVVMFIFPLYLGSISRRKTDETVLLVLLCYTVSLLHYYIISSLTMP